MSLVNPLGLAFGPAIGGLMQEAWGYQPLFITASLLAFGGLLLTTQIETEGNVSDRHAASQEIKKAEFWQTFLNPRVRVPSTILLLVGFAFGTLSAFMPILMQQKNIALNVGSIWQQLYLDSSFAFLLVVSAMNGDAGSLFPLASSSMRYLWQLSI
jgi:MFS family permease